MDARNERTSVARTLGRLTWLVWVGFASHLAAWAADAPPAPIPAAEAAGKMSVPAGFRVDLVASEPDVRQPIALAFDDRGRLWVAECFSYPQWEMNGKPGKDRLLILDDTDGDGRFDKRTVFADNIANLSGLEIGFGGVWVCATPNLLFLPDRDGDDRPDGPAEVVLDGWDLKAQHNVFNGLVWGPDGWLWGCNGILSNSRVGRPGASDSERTAINCGIWRYHPTRKVFEVVATGTTNPWGLDFDDLGEAFLTNCVIPHLFHVIPGAHYTRMFGQDFNPHQYGLIPTCADHVHWDTTERWLDIRTRGVTPTTDRAGGGHAHSGAAIYLGDSFPASYRNTVFMGNIHGNRVNHDRLERSGSGYKATHQPDFLLANDRWFRTVAQKLGPDGSLFVLDWSDTGECHEQDADGAHRENGRIYRVSHGASRGPRRIEASNPQALAALQSSPNEFLVRRARRLLQEQAAAGVDLSEAHRALRDRLRSDSTAPVRLRALWALNASGGATAADLTALLADRAEDLRAWAVRLLVEDRTRTLPDAQLGVLAQRAADDTSPKVRLALAAALQRLPVERRAPIGERLLAHPEDAADANLPLMVWYGIEPVVPTDLNRAARWASDAALPLIRRHAARRALAADTDRGLAAVVDRLASDGVSPSPEPLQGMVEALEGRRSVAMPARWPALAARLRAISRYDFRPLVARLSLTFGEPSAIAELRKQLGDPAQPLPARAEALDALAAARVPGLAPELFSRLDEPGLRVAALNALASYDDPRIPREILKRYRGLSLADREAAVQALAARPAWAVALLEAVGRGEVARGDVAVSVARQLQAFHRTEIDEALARHWGTLRPTAADKSALMSKYKALLTSESLQRADRSHGRAVFEATCRQCHRLYGEGGDIGPELTGSNRDNLDYLLENVLDPSATVAGDYRVANIATTDGRLVSGLLREQTPAAIVVQTLNGRVVIPRGEIEELRPTASSMMPEGLFDKLSEPDLRDLVAYLTTRSQIPLPAPRSR